MGMPVEGWKKEQIKKYVGRITKPIDPVLLKDKEGNLIKQDEFGELKYWTRRLKKGEYTDDTILTLAIAEAVGQLGLELDYVTQMQIEVYKENPGKAFGGTTKDAFKNIEKGFSPYYSGVLPGLGNGPAMKMHPLGMYMYKTKKDALEFAKFVGYSTHLDPRAVAGGIAQTNAVYNLLNDCSREDFIQSLYIEEDPLRKEHALRERGTLTDKINWIKENKDTSVENAYKTLGNSGLSFESVPFTWFMFQKYFNDPIEGLLKTINYGGDCDTTGAIYGALAGAKHGMIFPNEWIKELKGKEEIEEITKLYSS